MSLVAADTERLCSSPAAMLEHVERCHLGRCRYNIEEDAEGPACALIYAGAGPMRLEEIGQVFGLTRERIRQIEAKALGRRDVRRLLELVGVDGFTNVHR